MKSINPATQELIREYTEHPTQEVQRRLSLAENAFKTWRRASFDERASSMRRAAGVLRRKKDSLATLITREMGKPIAEAEAEIEKCAATCDFFAEKAETFLVSEIIESDASESYVRYEPLGPILAIMPWNFPFWQVFRFAAPNLMAGNVGLLKHAGNVCGVALAVEEVFREAGFPDGVFTTLLVETAAIESIIQNPIIQAVTLTGSEKAGMAVASQAGRALKKTVLELGGSDPFIVLEDVQIEQVARAAAEARCINAGQSCIAAKRFIVQESIADKFETAFAVAMSALKVGDPMDRATRIGPLAREDLLESLHDQVERSIQSGATLLTGGRRLNRRGYFYEPTVLAGVRPGMAAFDEETFGPVAAVIRAKDADDAVELANHSQFGLGAGIWTKNTHLAERLAADLQAGYVCINGPVRSDPRLPFGGIKHSGHGRELSELGIREFVNAKTVWVK